MTTDHANAVQDQFNPQASRYLDSPVHAQGPDLAKAGELVSQTWPDGQAQALDVGCGAGHLSFALAALLTRVTAVDPSIGMLTTVTSAAAARGLPNIHTCQASAEALPFDDACMDLVCSRYSAHHWTHLPTALAQLRRVLRPGGYLLMIDVAGDENALVDTHLQTMELLRDRSHVRNRAPSQWQALLREAGFAPLLADQWPLRLEFSSWVARMATPAANVAAIRDLQRNAPSEVQQALAIEADGSFTAHTGLWWARAN